MAKKQTPAQKKIDLFRRLIQTTHEHGLKLRRELITLDKQGKAKSLQARAKRALLYGLEALNKRRRRELERLEHKPPPPKPPSQVFTMYDTTDVGTRLPTSHPQAVAGYVGGSWPTYNGLKAKYPGAKHLSIAVNAGERARCLDVEPGDATPSEAPGWFRNTADHSEGKPVFYGDEENLVAFEEALRDNGIHRWEYYVWKAHYTGSPHIEAGSDATQYESVERGASNYDASLCEPYFL